MRTGLGTVLLAATAAFATPATAAPLIYSESVDGALIFNQALGNLDIGVNTVSGFRSSFEKFTVTVPETLRLTSITLAISNIFLAKPPPRVDQSEGNVFLSDALSNSAAFTTNDTFTIFSGSLDGEALIGVLLAGDTPGMGNVGVSYDYTVSFTVVAEPVPVPEPLGLALFGAGLLGLAAARRCGGAAQG